MKTCIQNLFPCLGVASTRSRACLGGASRAAWACLGGASWRSRVPPALIAALGLVLAGRVTAQTFTNLYSFTATDPTTGVNYDGAGPSAGLILSGNTLYGTAKFGGSSGYGTVFAVNIDGSGFTTVYDFYGGSDGARTSGGLILSGNTLYGTANEGGSWNYGTVFAVNTDGTGFTTLHSFAGYPSDGASPEGLNLSGNTLYGSAASTVFAVNTDGSGFTTLHRVVGNSVNFPSGGVILSGSRLFGTTTFVGAAGPGTVFKVNTDGTGATTLYVFAAGSGSFLGTYTNSDGAFPFGPLLLSGNTLYGTTFEGGSSGYGTVFAVNTDGTGFAKLHTFTGGRDGAYPSGGLVLSGNTLYGTTFEGGSSGNGTVFALNTDGADFATLYNFTGGTGGSYRLLVWFYRGTRCMGRRMMAAFRAEARCSVFASRRN